MKSGRNVQASSSTRGKPERERRAAGILPFSGAQPGYPAEGQIGFGLFLLYILFFYLQAGVRVPALGAIRFELILGATISAIAMYRHLNTSRYHKSDRLIGWYVALLVVMGVMVVFSHQPAQSWAIYSDRALKFAVLAFCIVSFVTSPRALMWFIGIYMLAFWRMGFEGLLGTLDGSMIWENQEIPRLHGTTPLYGHPNSFSGTQIGVIPYIYYLFPIVPWYWQAALASQLVLCLNVVLRTGSRTGYLGFLAAMICFVWTSRRKVRLLLCLVVAALVVVPLIPDEYIGRFTSIYRDDSAVGADTSIGQRKEILVDAWTIFLRHPFGVGVGAFPFVRSEMFGRIQDTHNLYLEVATNLGVPGFVVFVGLMVCLWRHLRETVRMSRRQLDRLEKAGRMVTKTDRDHIFNLRFLEATANATWVFLIVRLVLGVFGMDMFEVYWWFIGGLAIALRNIVSDAARITDPVGDAPDVVKRKKWIMG